ncbi:Flp family type IVb pilin [Pasteurella oralis]|uniref:Flp family type IVb pilin n=1 Tax=Pasteurella oralis TaxID=1071947 RepID=UPI000C7E166D|nr:Flp family type IVb pilin [Pasteurella oralis]
MNYFLKFKKCQKGITSIEYGLIGVVIAVFVVFVLYDDHGFILALKDRFGYLTSLVLGSILAK